MNRLQTFLLVTCAACVASGPVLASEKLPDQAQLDAKAAKPLPKKLPAKPMSSKELESLYLQAPIQLDNDVDTSMTSVNDKHKYVQSDLFFREVRQSQDLTTSNNQTAPPPDTTPASSALPVQPAPGRIPDL